MKQLGHLIATKFSLQFVLIVAFFDDINSIPEGGQLKVFHVTRKERYILHSNMQQSGVRNLKWI